MRTEESPTINEDTRPPYFHHDNPYHHRLEEFSDFVLRDTEGESLRGKWCEEVFKRNAPLAVEIGSGYGHFMLDYCEKNPNENFVGMDYRFKRSFQLAKKFQNWESNHFRFLRANGERLSHLFGENEVGKIFYFFPDPWPKNKHKKKRLFQLEFIQQAHEVLKSNGALFVKTDHEDYFNHMEKVALEQKQFEVEILTRDLYKDHPNHFLASFQTKFEKIFLSQGTKIKAMVLKPL